MNGYKWASIILGGFGAFAAFAAPLLWKQGEGHTFSEDEIEKVMEVIKNINNN
jgi:hypothetical protein